jgi:hypothetical protein
MLKIPKPFQAAVKVTETITCTCQRCGPEPTTWTPKQVSLDAAGNVMMPKLCPRCHSSSWWLPVQRKGTSQGMRDYHAQERLKKSSTTANNPHQEHDDEKD